MNSTLPSKPKKKALGRGLNALIPRQPVGAHGAASSPRDYFSCPLDQIEPAAEQPRKHFDRDALSDLSASIKESGLIQPLVVRRIEDAESSKERYELIAGERRWRASHMAGLREVPVVVKDVSDAVAFALALIENIQRQDLNPVEEALAYRRLLDEFEINQADLAEQLGKSRSAISNSVRLLNLPRPVLEQLAGGELTAGHARALLSVSEAHAIAIAAQIIDHQLTVRQTEHLTREIKDAGEDAPPDATSHEEGMAADEPGTDAPHTQDEAVEISNRAEAANFRDDASTRTLLSRLRDTLATSHVHLRDRHGKGRIEIHYESYEDLRAILQRLEIEHAIE